ncbi:MAG: cyclopropane-fatty-acyl-phospholipid synthase family protein [Planctomycetota bacterium]
MTALPTNIDRTEHQPRDTDREGGLMGLAERGWLPDGLVRVGIRRLLKQRLEEEASRGDQSAALRERLPQGPIAVKTEDANRQHYEVPADFYAYSLGHRLKYSGCYWPKGVTTLDDAEHAALGLACERAELADGMDILELGCGWGSLTLWMAEHYPNAAITAVSNSASQRAFILERAEQHGLSNINIITADINEFDTELRFDRVCSIEMFEHMANHHELLRRVSAWLKDDGKLFVHVFSHARFTYLFEEAGRSNWMGRHFFTGGIMPSHGYLPSFDEHLTCEADWVQAGTHYQKTAEAWLDNTDANRDAILPLFAETYGQANASIWLQRWRIFYMACAELWGYAEGKEWGVSHYRFAKRSY